MANTLPPPDGLLEHAGFLRALARSLLADPHQAEDIVQGAFLAALQHPPRPGSNRRAWLATVARNLAFRARRSEKRQGRREAEAGRPNALPSPEEVAARIELQHKMTAAVRALEEPYRSVIIHRYFDGLAPGEIAQASGTPLKTVKSRLYRALAMLRAQLDREHGGDRRAWSLLMLPLARSGGATGVVAGGLWAGIVGFTMKKAIVLILAGIAAVFLLWSSVWRDTQPAPLRAPGADATSVVEAKPDGPSPDDAEDSGDGAPKSAFTFSGRVVDPQGAGVAGARVALLFVTSLPEGHHTLVPEEVLRREAERFEAPATTTDAAGRFEIARPYESSSCLRVTADGFAPAFAGPVSPGFFATIEVRPLGAVLVKVRGPNGRPLAGADVRVQTLGTAGEARQVLAEARTDASGEVRLPAAGDHMRLLVVDPNRHDLGYLERAYDLADGSIDVTVPGVDVRTVRLLDATTGSPLPDGYIIIGSSRGTPRWDQDIARRLFRADAAGVVRYPNQEGYYGRFVTAPGYEILPLDRDVMPLRRSMRIEGIVRDPAGLPVAGAPVLVAGLSTVFERAYLALPFVSAWTGSDGRFSLEIKMLTAAHSAVPDPGARSLIALVAPHAPAIQDNVAVSPGGRIEVELRAPPAARVTIILTGREGAPVPDKLVQLRRMIPRAASWTDVRPDYGVDLLSLAGRFFRKTDAAGRIEFGPLAGGDYLMLLQHTRRTVSLLAGEHKEIEVLWGAGDAVFGQVLDSEGEPVAGINVGLGGKSSWVLQTDRQGRFRFDEVERGEYVVSVFGAGKQSRMRMPVRLNDENTIRLPAGAARLRILTSGPAADDLEFAVTSEHGLSVPSGAGFLQVERGGLTWDIPPGRGILIVRAKGWGWKAVAYEAAANDTTEIRLEMRRAGSVSGRLEEIPDARHVRIQLVPESSLPRLKGKLAELLAAAIRRTLGQASSSVEPEADGHFTCKDLSPGKYRARLLAWNAKNREWTETANAAVTIEAGAATTVRFDSRR